MSETINHKEMTAGQAEDFINRGICPVCERALYANMIDEHPYISQLSCRKQVCGFIMWSSKHHTEWYKGRHNPFWNPPEGWKLSQRKANSASLVCGCPECGAEVILGELKTREEPKESYEVVCPVCEHEFVSRDKESDDTHI